MRLTNSIKDKIVRNAIEKSGLLEEKEGLRAKFADWAEDVRVWSLGGEEEVKRLELIDKKIRRLSSDAGVLKDKRMGLERTTWMHLNVAGNHFKIYFCGATYDSDRNREVGSRLSLYHPKPIARDNPLAERFEELTAEADRIKDKIDTLKSNVRGALSSVTTIKKLIDAWPEAEELLPKEQIPSPKLPAIPTADLNAAIGLPSGDCDE